MVRFITQPGPPPPKNRNLTNLNKYIEIEPEPDEFLPEDAEESNGDNEEVSEISEVAEEDEVCLDWWIYQKPIEVYHCLQSPEKLAWDIFLWERLENIGIDQCVDVHPDAPCQPESDIPAEALYVVVGDTVMQNPYGHTALFCRKVKDQKTGYEKYKPVVGFFWSFINSNSTTVQSLAEYFHSRAAPSQLVGLYERIPPQDKIRFPEVFNIMTRTVNQEMKLLENGRRILRNTMGTNRHRPTRWRSNIQTRRKSMAPTATAPKGKKRGGK
jgi:hypothetical protein